MIPIAVGDLVKVEGKSRHGKNRIHEANSSIWRVRKLWGSKVLLETLDDDPVKQDLRWVDGDNDPHFFIAMKVYIPS